MEKKIIDFEKDEIPVDKKFSIKEIHERNEKIFWAILVGGKTISEYSEKLGLTEIRLRQILYYTFKRIIKKKDEKKIKSNLDILSQGNNYNQKLYTPTPIKDKLNTNKEENNNTLKTKM